MKKLLLLTSLLITLFSGSLHQLQAQDTSVTPVVFETTVARYCQGMELTGTLDDQTKLF